METPATIRVITQGLLVLGVSPNFHPIFLPVPCHLHLSSHARGSCTYVKEFCILRKYSKDIIIFDICGCRSLGIEKQKQNITYYQIKKGRMLVVYVAQILSSSVAKQQTACINCSIQYHSCC